MRPFCKLHFVCCAAKAAAFVLILTFTSAAFTQAVPPGAGRYGVSSTKRNLNLKARAARSAKALGNAAAPKLAAANAVANSGPISVSALKVFDSGVVGQSTSQNLTLTNTSESDSYSISIASVEGSGLADFQVEPCSSASLAPKASCEIDITFNSHAAGASNATLNLTATLVTTGSKGSETPTPQQIPVPLTGTSAASCPAAPGALLPLSRAGVTTPMINCFYNTSSNLAFATEVKYLYNPGGTANTVNGNLASMQFPGGVQLSVLGNVNTASSSSPAKTTSASFRAASGAAWARYAASGSSTTTPSLNQAVQAITQGGNFALNGLWPIVNLRGLHMQLLSVADPKLGFEVSGLSSQNTITGASDVNGNLSSETYFQIDALPSSLGGDSPGSVFVDYRGGWERVSSDFAKNAGLKIGNSFGLQQFSAGLVVNGFLRISAQRYFGPEQAFVNSAGKTATVNNFKNWQLAIQLVPSTGKSKKPTGANTN